MGRFWLSPALDVALMDVPKTKSCLREHLATGFVSCVLGLQVYYIVPQLHVSYHNYVKKLWKWSNSNTFVTEGGLLIFSVVTFSHTKKRTL